MGMSEGQIKLYAAMRVAVPGAFRLRSERQGSQARIYATRFDGQGRKEEYAIQAPLYTLRYPKQRRAAVATMLGLMGQRIEPEPAIEIRFGPR
jgi:hypothetical protein